MNDGQLHQPREGRRFHLKERLGAGAFGEVFRAEQDSGAGFRRPVALKVLNAHVSGSREAARRMRDEARVLGRLSHRNIVGVLDLVQLGDKWAVVMEYVTGADLEHVLSALERAQESFPAPAALEVGVAVCRALDAAWSADDGSGGQLNVVHRDIKPANIRLTADGEVKVLDFGVARMNLDTRESATRVEGWIGTERYMAPERILVQGDLPAGDVYATVATVVELLLGRPLGRTPVLEHTHGPFVDESLAQVREVLIGPEEAVEDVIALLRRCLHALPENRPTASELVVAFAALSRRLEGETLEIFAPRFVPTVSDLLGQQAEPVEGVLSEGSSLVAETLTPEMGGASSETFLELDIPDPAAAEPRWPLGPMVAAVASLILLLAVVAGVAVVRGVSSSEDRPTVSEPPPAVVEPTAAGVEEGILTPVASPGEAVEEAAEEATEEAVEEAPATPTAPAPREPAPAAADSPAPAVGGPPVSRAMVVLENASSLSVTCQGTTANGTASVRIRDFPAGACTIAAQFAGQDLTTEVRIEGPVEVRCAVSDGALTCR